LPDPNSKLIGFLQLSLPIPSKYSSVLPKCHKTFSLRQNILKPFVQALRPVVNSSPKKDILGSGIISL